MKRSINAHLKGDSREAGRSEILRTMMLETVVIYKDEHFAELEEEWEDLYRNAPAATPFQSWAWLYSWWEHYGESNKLRLVVIRDRGLLVGLMPLMLERRGGLGRLLFVGTGLTDYLDVLIRQGWEDRILEAGRRALEEMDGWHVIDLQQLRPAAATWNLFEGWSGPRTCVWQENSSVIDVKPWDEQLAALSRNHRSTARRAIRRVEAEGVRCKLAGVDDAKRAARRLVALHREAWQGRDIGPEHLTQRFEAHLEAAVCRMTARGLGGVSEFWRNKTVIISDFVMFWEGVVGTYLQGASQEALQRYQVSALYIWNALMIARDSNSSYVDLLRGDEPYKLRWTSNVIPNQRVILGRRWASWAPYAGYQALYSRARQYKKSDGAPRWVTSAGDRYRTLRHAAARLANKDKRL